MLAALLLAGLSLAASPARALKAAAAKVDITPDLRTERTYLAGFGAKGRRPTGVHDALYARLVILSDGRKTVAIVSLDLLGLYRNDVSELRRLSGFDAPERYLLVAATHDHSGPDTLGLWGPAVGVSGRNRRYQARVKALVAARLKALLGELRPARLAAANARLNPRGLCRDSRDPVAIDPYLGVLGLRGLDGRAIATVVNWSCHPEVLGADNRLITADFPGPLCERVEKRTGGACVYLSGAIGGLMTPDVVADNFYESSRVGTTVADAALAALDRSPATAPEPRLSVKSETPLIPIENSRYLLLLPALAFGHDILDAQGRALPRWQRYWLPLRHLLLGLPPARRPWVRTEVSVLDAGPARLLALPGEVFPELIIGGYRGEFRFGHELISPRNPDPPDLSKAPSGPTLWEQMGAPVRLVVGLANDEIGYVVPSYDFKVRGNAVMLPRLPGHHYEETNSIGPSAARILMESAQRLLK